MWKDYRRILSEYGVLVYPRKGYDMKRICDGLMAESGKYRITLADAPTVDVSSTEIREGLASGENMSDVML